MTKLSDIASFAVKKTGIFHNAQTRKIATGTCVSGKKYFANLTYIRRYSHFAMSN